MLELTLMDLSNGFFTAHGELLENRYVMEVCWLQLKEEVNATSCLIG